MKDLRTLCDEAIQLWDADCDMDGVIREMRAHLAQPVQPNLTDEELKRRFLTWWREEASAMRPHPEHDHVEHARRISEIAWANGAYVSALLAIAAELKAHD
jgi:hypothetical protein